MKKALLTLSLLFIVSGVSRGADVFYAQASAGSADGTSCINAKALPISPWTAGNTYHLCGTITSTISVGASGTSNNPITIQWESGASVQACNTTASINIGGRSFLVLDLGGNATAITCPNNGTNLATQINAVAIGDGGSGWGNVEIRNGTIGPMFVKTDQLNTGFSSACITATQNARNSHIHHIHFKGCANTINYAMGTSNSTNDEFDHNTVDASCGRFLNFANANDGTYTILNPSVHDNDVNYSSVWGVPGGFQHYEIIHVFNRGTGTSNDLITNLQIYNNYFHGQVPVGGTTAGIFIGEGGSSCSSSSFTSAKIYNNLFVNTPGGGAWSAGAGGFIYDQDCEHSIEVYNNTIDGGDNTVNSCFEINGAGTGTNVTWTVKNNICLNVQFAWAWPNSSSTTVVSNNNIYNGIKQSGFGGWQFNGTTSNTSFANWKTQTSQDGASSNNVAPGLNTDYTITNTSSLAHTLPGLDLTSLNITNLDTSAPANFGTSGSCGTGCVARPSGASWDVGLYQFGSAPPLTLNPTSLVYGNQATGTTSLGQTVTLSNTGGSTLTITSIAPTTGTQFSISANTCSATLAVGASCNVTVVFAPTLLGAQTDSLVFTTSSPNSPNSVALGGTGTGFSLTVQKAGTGSGTVTGGLINCGTTCSQTSVSGTQVTLTGVPAGGSAFAGWSGGGCSGTGGCTVTLNNNVTVTATFNTAPTQVPCVVFTGNITMAGNLSAVCQ